MNAATATWRSEELLDFEALNREVGLAEQRHDLEFFRELLADDLLFRRATGL